MSTMRRPGTLDFMEGWERNHALEHMASHIGIGHHVKMICAAGELVGRALEADQRRRWWEDSEANRDRLWRGQNDLEEAEHALREWVLGRLEQAYELGLQRGRGGAGPALNADSLRTPPRVEGQ